MKKISKYSFKSSKATKMIVRTQTCMACLATSSEDIDVLGHNFVKDETSAVEPTCEDPGKMADMKCSRCTAVMTGEEIPALGHDWDVWVVTKEATEVEASPVFFHK